MWNSDLCTSKNVSKDSCDIKRYLKKFRTAQEKKKIDRMFLLEYLKISLGTD